jgi:peptidoglycan-N-acetylglucosamine deacetylase
MVIARRCAQLAVIAAGAHAAPGLLSIDGVRTSLFPELSGIGRPGHVALTFDDGPDVRSTPLFIDALEKLGWSATFFLLGCETRSNREVARQLVDSGHEIGVHGDVHRNHLARAPRALRADITRAKETLHQTTGVEPRWFRPPYGALSWTGLKVAAELDMHTVLWSAWGRDWRRQATPTTVYCDVVRNLRSGGTVLLHDSDCTSAPDSWRSTLGALPRLASYLERNDLRVGTLGEHGIRPSVVDPINRRSLASG